jgi:hypothetical protein
VSHRPSLRRSLFHHRKLRVVICQNFRGWCGPFTPKNEVATGEPMGSTGNLPVPSGNLPLGRVDAGYREVDAAVDMGATNAPLGW